MVLTYSKLHLELVLSVQCFIFISGFLSFMFRCECFGNNSQLDGLFLCKTLHNDHGNDSRGEIDEADAYIHRNPNILLVQHRTIFIFFTIYDPHSFKCTRPTMFFSSRPLQCFHPGYKVTKFLCRCIKISNYSDKFFSFEFLFLFCFPIKVASHHETKYISMNFWNSYLLI